METAGAIATIAGVIGLVGQIIEGCMTVRGIIGDIKDAREEIRRLAEYINHLEEDSKAVLLLHAELEKRVGPHDVVGKSLKVHLASIKTLEQEILSLISGFGVAPRTSISQPKKSAANIRNIWNGLKYSGKKEDTESKIKWVERTSDRVQCVRANMIQYVTISLTEVLGLY